MEFLVSSKHSLNVAPLAGSDEDVLEGSGPVSEKEKINDCSRARREKESEDSREIDDPRSGPELRSIGREDLEKGSTFRMLLVVEDGLGWIDGSKEEVSSILLEEKRNCQRGLTRRNITLRSIDHPLRARRLEPDSLRKQRHERRNSFPLLPLRRRQYDLLLLWQGRVEETSLERSRDRNRRRSWVACSRERW